MCADIEAIVMELPSRAAVLEVAHSLGLDTDLATPTQLTEERLQQITIHPKVKSLFEMNINLTTRIQAAGYKSLAAASGTSLYAKKMRVQA